MEEMIMEKKFGLADDKYVGSVVFYVKSGKIYEDAATTTLAKTADLKHAFEMGTLLLVDGNGVEARALAVSVASEVATVLATFAVSEGAFTAVSLTNSAT
jgi:hypothetical protein